jgi:hypothetical protein
MTSGDTGGNIATYCQIEEPVKPTTVFTPSFWARRAVSFISSAARERTPRACRRPRPAAPHRLVAEVDRVVAHSLALEVVRDGPDLQAVAFEDVQPVLDVGVIVPPPRVEVVTGYRDLHPS